MLLDRTTTKTKTKKKNKSEKEHVERASEQNESAIER